MCCQLIQVLVDFDSDGDLDLLLIRILIQLPTIMKIQVIHLSQYFTGSNVLY